MFHPEFRSVVIEEDSSPESSEEISYFDNYSFKYISTDCGYFYVAFSNELEQNPLRKPVIITFHDVGFNFRSNFESFFAHPKMQSILQQFNVLHVNAPGQELFAKSLVSSDAQFVSLDQIADGIQQVVQYFGINEFVGFGIGTGGNVLIRLERKYPKMVNGLFLVNVSFDPPGWLGTLKERTIAHLLRNNSKASHLVQKFLLRNFFSKNKTKLSVSAEKHYFHPAFNVHNFACFLQAHLERTKLNLQRDDKKRNISCPVLLVTSQFHPSLDDTMQMFSKLNPTNSSYLCVDDSTDAMQDKPADIAYAFDLFLQGLGFIAKYRLAGMQGDQLQMKQ